MISEQENNILDSTFFIVTYLFFLLTYYWLADWLTLPSWLARTRFPTLRRLDVFTQFEVWHGQCTV